MGIFFALLLACVLGVFLLWFLQIGTSVVVALTGLIGAMMNPAFLGFVGVAAVVFLIYCATHKS
jgi:hypothetical protein